MFTSVLSVEQKAVYFLHYSVKNLLISSNFSFSCIQSTRIQHTFIFGAKKTLQLFMQIV